MRSGNNRYVPKHLIGLKNKTLNKRLLEHDITGVIISDIAPLTKGDFLKIEPLFFVIIENLENPNKKKALIMFEKFRDNFFKIKKGDKIKFSGMFLKVKQNTKIDYRIRFFAHTFTTVNLSRQERQDKINKLINDQLNKVMTNRFPLD